MSDIPVSPWSDESMWLPSSEESSLPQERLEHAEMVVRSLGFPVYTMFEISMVGEYLISFRPTAPGSRYGAVGSPSYLVGPDDRVFIVPVVPGTGIVAAEQILSERYSQAAPLSEEEHSILETRIQHLARDLAAAWG